MAYKTTDPMANLWAKRIVSGEKTLSDVPAKLLDRVKAELVAMGYPELANPEE